MSIEELSDRTHNGMMNRALHGVAALFEQDGWGPCDAIKAANELLKPAWDAWSTLMERVTADDQKIKALEAQLAAEVKRREAAERERDKDLAEMRRFQRMVIELTHAKNTSEAELAEERARLESCAYRLRQVEGMNSSLLKRLGNIQLACRPESMKMPDGKEWTFYPPDNMVRMYWEHLSKYVMDALRGDIQP